LESEGNVHSHIFIEIHSGRFARDRSSGFGSNYVPPRKERRAKEPGEDVPSEQETPTPLGLASKLCCGRKAITKIDEGSSNAIKKVPPPDFYLGETPGTQIWARLRLAGLETERIFDLDTRNVMIKMRCPTDRLMDVAEVLMLRLKTFEGKPSI